MKKKKIIVRVLLSFLAFIVLVFSLVVFIFRNEVTTLASAKKVDQYGFYQMDYKGDYGFDKFLKKGASTDKELVSFISKQLLKGLPINIDIPDLGCSTFNAQDPDGDYLFGRNFDLDYAPPLMISTSPENGYKSMSMVNLGFLGYGKNALDKPTKRLLSLASPYIPLDGINEKGVSMGILLLPDKPTHQKTNKVPITSTTAIRLVLDKAASVDEALKLLEKYDMNDSANSCYHYQIADASGKSVIVEYINNKMNVLTPEQGKKYIAATNFYRSPGVKFNKGDGQDRYKVITKELDDKKGELSEKEVMSLLDDVHKDTTTRKKFKGTSETQWSVVYNNTKKTMKIVVGHQYDKVYDFNMK